MSGFTPESVSTVEASDGNIVPVDSLPQVLAYSNGLLSTITVVFGTATYVQFYTYTNSVLTSISAWVKQ
jgi:hypothetical protein